MVAVVVECGGMWWRVACGVVWKEGVRWLGVEIGWYGLYNWASTLTE